MAPAPQQPRKVDPPRPALCLLALFGVVADKLDEKRAEYEDKKEALLAKLYVVEAGIKTVLKRAGGRAEAGRDGRRQTQTGRYAQGA